MSKEGPDIGQRWAISPGILLGALWLASLALFVAMAFFAARYETFSGDLFLAHRWQRVDVPVLGGAVAFVNALGFALAASVITAVAAAPLALKRHWPEAALVILTLAPRFLHLLVKGLVERPRPTAELARVTESAPGASFPSGHSVGAIAFFGLLFCFADRLVEQASLRILLRAFCLFMILATGPARVYTGAHWPSDVVGGYLFGLLFLLPFLAVDRALRLRSMISAQ